MIKCIQCIAIYSLSKGGFTMTEQLLRASLKKAQEKGQVGLLIWANWTQWDDWSNEIKQGNASYEFALSKVIEGKEATITFEWLVFKRPPIFAVSVSKLLSSNEFFKEVLDICEKTHHQGPITLIPSNELFEGIM